MWLITLQMCENFPAFRNVVTERAGKRLFGFFQNLYCEQCLKILCINQINEYRTAIHDLSTIFFHKCGK